MGFRLPPVPNPIPSLGRLGRRVRPYTPADPTILRGMIAAATGYDTRLSPREQFIMLGGGMRAGAPGRNGMRDAMGNLLAGTPRGEAVLRRNHQQTANRLADKWVRDGVGATGKARPHERVSAREQALALALSRRRGYNTGTATGLARQRAAREARMSR